MTDRAGVVVPINSVPKSRLVPDKVALDPGTKPTPFNETDCGLPTVSSVMVMEALRGPAWLGVNVTVTVQFAPAARLEPQVLLWPKSAALVPAIVMLLIAKTEPLVLVSVTGCTPLVVPVNCAEKFRLGDERVRLPAPNRMETVYARVADCPATSATSMVNATPCAAMSGVPEIVAVFPLLLSERL